MRAGRRGERLKAWAGGHRLVSNDGVFGKIVGDYPRNGRGIKAFSGREVGQGKSGAAGRLGWGGDRLRHRFQRGDPVLMLVGEIKDVAAFRSEPARLIG